MLITHSVSHPGGNWVAIISNKLVGLCTIHITVWEKLQLYGHIYGSEWCRSSVSLSLIRNLEFGSQHKKFDLPVQSCIYCITVTISPCLQCAGHFFFITIDSCSYAVITQSHPFHLHNMLPQCSHVYIFYLTHGFHDSLLHSHSVIYHFR